LDSHCILFINYTLIYAIYKHSVISLIGHNVYKHKPWIRTLTRDSETLWVSTRVLTATHW